MMVYFWVYCMLGSSGRLFSNQRRSFLISVCARLHPFRFLFALFLDVSAHMSFDKSKIPSRMILLWWPARCEDRSGVPLIWGFA